MNAKWQSGWLWGGVVLLGIMLLGCRQPQPPQLIEVVTVTSTVTPTVATRVTNPTIAAELARITPTATATPTVTPTTAFACPPPSGWVSYTIAAYDTLHSLAFRTDTTVDALKFANCLIDDIIIIGERIYLPTLPPTPPPAVYLPPAPPAGSDTVPTASCSPFSCPNRQLAEITLAPGGPNNPNPCQRAGISIDSWPEARQAGKRQKGEIVYFFGCTFSRDDSLTMTITGPGSVESLTPLLSDNIPDYRGQLSIPLVIWGATCDLVNGLYTLTFTDGQGNRMQESFELIDATNERLLVIPPFGPRGTSYDLYGCGYSSASERSVLIDVYYAIERMEEPEGIGYTFTHVNRVTMMLNDDGWGHLHLPSLSSDPMGAYWLQDRDERQTGEALMWLTGP